MEASSIPSKVQLPFAGDAAAGDIRSIPENDPGSGGASFELGFPPANFEPVASGGVPPFGKDMNGILNFITLWIQWLNAGGPITYDSTFQGEVGGYPKSAIVQSATTSGKFWQSTADNNTTNPDTGGAGWEAAYQSFPSGTRLAFNQAAAPTGWTQDTTSNLNDSLMRIVTGSGGGAGGSTGFSAVNAQTVTGGHSLVTGELPAHSHGVNDPGHAHSVNDPGHDHGVSDPEHTHPYANSNVTGVPHAVGSGTPAYASQSTGNTSAAATGISVNDAYTSIAIDGATTGITTQNTGSGTAHSHSVTFNILYHDFIIAVKS